MGAADKAQNAMEDMKGKAKEGLGKATDDESMEAEGKADQGRADLKKAMESTKDAFKK